VPPSGTVSLRDRIPGCFVLSEGAWSADTNLAKFYPLDRIPRQIRFDTTRIVGWDAIQDDARPMKAVKTNPVGPSGYSPFIYWMHTAGDSIYVGAPLPMGGASLRLWPAPDGFEGTLTTFTDAVPADGITDARAPLRLQQVRCP
jgi:hypothetical protein